MSRNPIKRLVTIAVMVCVIPLGIYIYYMWYRFGFSEISKSSADWGAFGSYLSGILSPLFTLVSVAFVYYSIQQNNKNHSSEMNYLTGQQIIGNIESLSNAFNEKLKGEFNSSHPLVSDIVISIYGESAEGDEGAESDRRTSSSTQQLKLDKEKKSLASLLDDYVYFSDPDQAFHWQYLNFLSAITYDLFRTFVTIMEYTSKIKDEAQKEGAVRIFDAITDSNKVMALMHLLAGRLVESSCSRADTYALEGVFGHIVNLSDYSENLKFSSVPYFKRLLTELIGNAFCQLGDGSVFALDYSSSVCVLMADEQKNVKASLILGGNEVEINGHKIIINAILRAPLFAGANIDVDYRQAKNHYLASVEVIDGTGILAALGRKPPVYVMTFTLVGKLFKLIRVEIV
ncbi:hypothetical protein NTD80_01990 [Pseudomonas sp. 13B_2.1_Bac1]|uniref:hypothetical protein n=1 Tax=Pseudomonas sp. 13B_2.1_Bac1 TaxID=2971624 RepID=UPI0021C5B635|nr:hypothetical protein [Pseudomonas sp. 13B_2.1_Bac1]MCU1781513.1 hypothetical protein [Pseudomonas sp. 13B_2.1_Bac1]